MRALGLYEVAEQSWSRLSPEARASLTAYAAGVNAWLAQDHVLPPEFIALGLRPEPWREVDSLAWAKVFALNLSNNMWNETSNRIASQYLSKEQMVDLLGYSQSDLSAAAPRGVMGEQVAAGLLAFCEGLESELKIGGRYVGSNAWVVSGRLMQGGQAALANDPHLGVQMPSPWYVARLKGDRLNVSGMTLVGLPIVIFGQNGDIAWGGTNMMADVQDLYIEQPIRPTLRSTDAATAGPASMCARRPSTSGPTSPPHSGRRSSPSRFSSDAPSTAPSSATLSAPSTSPSP